MQYTVYNTKGEIQCSIKCPPDLIDNQLTGLYENCSYITGSFDDNLYFIQNGVAVSKSPFQITVSKTSIIADTLDTLSIAGLPAGTAVTMSGVTDIVNDGIWEVSVDTPGTYKVDLSLFPYLDKEVSFEATAPV